MAVMTLHSFSMLNKERLMDPPLTKTGGEKEQEALKFYEIPYGPWGSSL